MLNPARIFALGTVTLDSHLSITAASQQGKMNIACNYKLST